MSCGGDVPGVLVMCNTDGEGYSTVLLKQGGEALTLLSRCGGAENNRSLGPRDHSCVLTSRATTAFHSQLIVYGSYGSQEFVEDFPHRKN
jgi:hypothetical protein